MSWKNILKEHNLNFEVREALMLMGDKKYAEETILHHGTTREGIANIIDDLKAAMTSTNYNPKTDAGMPKAIKALEELLDMDIEDETDFQDDRAWFEALPEWDEDERNRAN